MKVKGMHKDICLKTLSKGLIGRFTSKFTKENTIIINDSSLKHILNDLENVLLPVSWSQDGAGPSDTFSIDTLLLCQQKLLKCLDLKVAARVHHWIGQPMLFEDPSTIGKYVKIKESHV